MMPHRALCHPLLRLAGVLVCLLALLVASTLPGMVRAAAPTLTLDPDHGLCDSPNGTVTARGTGFAAGTAIVIDAQIAPPKGVVAGRATVGDDGSFAVPLQLHGAIGCDQQYTLDVVPADASGPTSPPLLASATLTVTAAQAAPGDAPRCCTGLPPDLAPGALQAGLAAVGSPALRWRDLSQRSGRSAGIHLRGRQ